MFIILFIAIASPKTESRASGYFGLVTGLAFPTNASATFAFGATFNWDFFGDLGISATYLSYGSSITITSDGDTVATSVSYTDYLFEATYALSGTLENFIIGGKLGIINVVQSANVATTSTTMNFSPELRRLVFGPKIAYDYIFSDFSIGLEISYIFGIGSDAPSSLTLLPVIKFWF